MRHTLFPWLALLLTASLLGEAAEPPPFFKGREEGWFWYKDPKEKARKEPVVPIQPMAPPVTPPPAKPAPFSVAWLRVALETAREKALDDPTEDNTATYLYLQRVMMDKSESFSDSVQTVLEKDPYLDESARIPIASAARSSMNYYTAMAKRQVIGDLSKVGGIFFFFDSSCSFCVTQWDTVKLLKSRYPGLQIINVSLDGKGLPGMKEWVNDTGQFKRFELRLVPAVVLAIPPKDVMVLSQGAMALDELEDRAVRSADHKGLVPKEYQAAINVNQRGRLTAADVRAGGELPDDDPKAWVDYLRRTLKGRYQ